MRLIILEFCNYVDYPIGGYLSFAKQLVKAFGTEISVVGISTTMEPVGKWEKKIISGYPVNFFNIASISAEVKRPLIPRRFMAWWYYMKHRKKIFINEFDVIFVQTPEALFALPKLSFSHNLIVRVPGLEPPLSISRYWYAKYFSGIFQWIFMRALNRADAILATADKKNVEQFITKTGSNMLADRIHSFPSRFDETIFYPRSKSVMRDKLGLRSDITYLVTSGRISEKKGWWLLLNALEILIKRIPNVTLIFIGDGEDRLKLQAEVMRRNLNPNVIITSMLKQKAIAQYLCAADLYVSASEVEGWSTSLMEAVACGLYAIVTDFSSASDLVIHGKSGYICKNRSPKLFAKYISSALLMEKDFAISRVNWVQQFSLAETRNSLEKFIKST